MVKKTKYIIGIDEVGRGPVAGPVTIGAVCMPAVGYSWRSFKGLKDSKKLTEKSREEWFTWVRRAEDVSYTTSSVQATYIDTHGIVPAINKALSQSLKKINILPSDCVVLLDGGLFAPKMYMQQKTIIKGDEKEYAIALASVMAKVTRDRKMVVFSKKFPEYGFEAHKGYGTEKHYEALKKHGLSDLHRRSFLQKKQGLL